MARIRTIKPEFPLSETIGELSRDARLLFIQLWTIADDSGKSRASSRVLASLLYPFDYDARDQMDSWLAELADKDLVRLYEIDGTRYLWIPKWLKHQKIDHPSRSKIPDFREDSRVLARVSAPDLGPRTKDKGPSKKERTPYGVPKKDAPPPASPPDGNPQPDEREGADATAPEKAAQGRRLPEDWTPGDEGAAFARELGLDPDRVFQAFRDYWLAQAGAKGRKADWPATWRNWCRKDAERLPRPSGGHGGPKSTVIDAGKSVLEAINRREAGK